MSECARFVTIDRSDLSHAGQGNPPAFGTDAGCSENVRGRLGLQEVDKLGNSSI